MARTQKKPAGRCSSHLEDRLATETVQLSSPSLTTASFKLDEVKAPTSQRSGRTAVPKWAIDLSSKELARRAGEFRVRPGWYLGLGAAYADISTEELNGTLLLVGSDTIVLPNVDPGFGGAISLGYRFDKMAFELTYLQTEHDGDHVFPVPGSQYDVTFQSFALNLRQYFLLKRHFQPFLSVGIASTQVTIENGAFLGALNEDATLEDELSLNLGIGFSLFLTDRFALNFVGEYRAYNNYFEAEGVTSKGGTSGVNGTGVNAIASLSYIF